jgi:YidC/Oxa1 family membrane protein insertase
MNNPKNMLLMALFFLGFLLYMQWQQDYAPKPVINETHQKQESADSTKPIERASTQDIPEVSQPTINTPEIVPAEQKKRATGTIITVISNVLKLKIDTLGGSIVYAELLKYPVKKYSKENIVLLNQNPQTAYFAQSGLISAQQSFVHTDIYSADKTDYQVHSGLIKIPLSIEKDGVKLVKTYVINADSYEIKLIDNINNNSSKDWLGQQYRQLQRTDPWLNKTASFNDSGRMSFKGASYFEPEEGYIKLDFEDFTEEPIKTTIKSDGWIAMVQHYFFSAYILKDSENTIESKYLPNSQTPYLIRATSNAYQVPIGSSKDISTELYIGPKIQEHLPEIAKGLDLTVDYGIFTTIAKPLFWVLNKIHGIVGNWGWSIILLTILIKLLFFKLTEKQYNSMARMRKLQPRIKTLKERHKDNKQKFNEEMMGLYKKEKVNPMGGCLPMLVQIPVFIALYWVLLESVELRQAPFMLWLQDLSSPDPYYILPAINAFAMFMTQKLSPTPGMDPMQAKIMKFMPLAFSVMFAFFQSGLVLYWAVNSSLSLLQQWIITKRIDAKG